MAKQGNKKRKTLAAGKENKTDEIIGMNSTEADFTCPICLDLVVEPVYLPCKHELCRVCFESHITENNLQCPICRQRISVWARKKRKKEGSYVHQERWERIQQLFPQAIDRRMRGEDNDDIQRALAPLRIISEEGEIQKEYQEELQKVRIEDNVNQMESEKLIRDIEEKDRLQQEILRMQELEDERLAKELQNELCEVQSPRARTPSLRLRRKSRKSSSASNSNPPVTKSSKLLNWLSPSSRRKDLASGSSSSTDDCFTPNSAEELERRDRSLAMKLQRELNRNNIKS